MKNEIKNDLEELISIIQSDAEFSKIFADLSPIQSAINSLLSSRECFCEITNLSFIIDKKLKNVYPDVDRFSIVVNNRINYKKNEDTISIGDYNLDLIIYGYKAQQKYQFCWHLDKHLSSGKDRYAHPIFHFQAGGKLAQLASNEQDKLYIGTPRISYPPMDIFLAINFILNNFYDNKTYGFVKKLMVNDKYRNLIKKAQKRIMDPYIKGLSDSTVHDDYNIKTILPTYIQ